MQTGQSIDLRKKTKKDKNKIQIIINLISSPAGIKCQDYLMYKQIEEYEAEVRNLGVKDAKAVGECINIRHQGGYGAVPEFLVKPGVSIPLTISTRL